MRQKSKRNRWGDFKKFYQLYKRDLSLADIDRLIKKDMPGLLDFYRRDMEQPDSQRSRLVRSLIFIRNFFLAFLLKLTAARRVFYSLSLILFLYGLFTGWSVWIITAFIALNLLLALEVADKLMAKDELEVAREIQTGLMPRQVPRDLPYDIACFSEPAREVGGDYYDFIRLPDHPQLYLVIGHVKGKGMAAALYMVQVQALLQYVLDHYQSPAGILKHLNKNARRILKPDYFFSMMVAEIDGDGSLRFARAGHMPLIHYQAVSDQVLVREPRGMAVGLENGSRFDNLMEELTLQPAPDDVLVFFTDGVVETMDGQLNQYGEAALRRMVRDNARRPAAEILESILNDLARFRKNTPPHDDLTLIVAKRKRSSGE